MVVVGVCPVCVLSLRRHWGCLAGSGLGSVIAANVSFDIQLLSKLKPDLMYTLRVSVQVTKHLKNCRYIF